MNNISIDNLIELQKQKNIILIDIRPKEKYQLGHIKNSININYNNLKINPEKYLKKENIYYIYCQSGMTSKVLTNYLNAIGYNVINVIGGYNNYLLKQ